VDRRARDLPVEHGRPHHARDQRRSSSSAFASSTTSLPTS
jgi:hypothetical protein